MTAVENAAWAVVNELLASIEQYDRIGPTYTLSCGTECFDACVLLDRRELLEKLRDELNAARETVPLDPSGRLVPAKLNGDMMEALRCELGARFDARDADDLWAALLHAAPSPA